MKSRQQASAGKTAYNNLILLYMDKWSSLRGKLLRRSKIAYGGISSPVWSRVDFSEVSRIQCIFSLKKKK